MFQKQLRVDFFFLIRSLLLRNKAYLVGPVENVIIVWNGFVCVCPRGQDQLAVRVDVVVEFDGAISEGKKTYYTLFTNSVIQFMSTSRNGQLF